MPGLAKPSVPELEDDRAWKKHSDRLARQLSDADWDAVERAYASIGMLAWRAKTLTQDQLRTMDYKEPLGHIDAALSRLG